MNEIFFDFQFYLIDNFLGCDIVNIEKIILEVRKMKNFISTNGIKNLNNIYTLDEYIKTYVDNLKYMGIDAYYNDKGLGPGWVCVKTDDKPILLISESQLSELYDEQLRKQKDSIEYKNRKLITNILDDMFIELEPNVFSGPITDRTYFHIDADGWRDHSFQTDHDAKLIDSSVVLACILNDIEYGLWGVDLRVASVQKILRYISAFDYDGDAAGYVIRKRNEIKQSNKLNDLNNLNDMEEVFNS